MKYPFKDAAIKMMARLYDRVSDARARYYASPDRLREMQEAYDALQKPPISSIDDLKVFRQINRPNGLIDEQALDQFMADHPIEVPDLILEASAACLAIKNIINLKENAETSNPDVYFIRDKNGKRVTLDNLTQIAFARQDERKLAYLRNMVIAISQLGDNTKNEIRSPFSALLYEEGETNYGYGIRMMATVISQSFAGANGIIMEDGLMQKIGLQDRVSESLLRSIFNDVAVSINSGSRDSTSQHRSVMVPHAANDLK